MRNALVFSLLSLAVLTATAGAQQATIVPQVRTKPTADSKITAIELAAHFVTAIRVPEPVNSVVVGDPALFQVEHSEHEPELVFVKALTNEHAESNLLISTARGRQISFLLVSRGDGPSSAKVDFLLRYQPSGGFLVEPNAVPFAMVAQTASVSKAQAAIAPSAASIAGTGAASASLSELRVAFKLRDLELKTAGVPRSQRTELERAFNIVGQPELRACYDTLLAEPEAPAIFPYGGFGSLLAAGEPSRDGRTFFARRILAFSPDLRRRRFRVPLRRCDFYDDRALCRDVRRKLEFWLCPAVLHTLWDRRWNQWKHLLGTKIEVAGTFVLSGKYRKRRGEWELVTWETALPSRLEVKLPSDFQQQVEAARTTYHRFGQYAQALDRIRLRLEHRAAEREELERMCAGLHLPGDFDVALISWRPDYDPFFYLQLSRRARRIYLFRDEYIFDVEKAVVVETPQLGHATYIFAKPRNMDGFLALYTTITKDDIRRNRNNVAERLGFLGRVIHGTNPRAWLKEVRQRVGEGIDFAAAIAE